MAIMLALSTFRRSGKAEKQAIKLAADGPGKLIIVMVADQNLARYFIGTDAVAGSKLRELCEQDLIEEHRKEGLVSAEAIAAEAEKSGVECESVVTIGRFAIVVLDAIAKEQPEMVVTTRAKRPNWVRRFFGSPVDTIISEAPCPVVLV